MNLPFHLKIMASLKSPTGSEKDLAFGNVEPARDTEKHASLDDDDGEVFKKTADGVNYRTNGW